MQSPLRGTYIDMYIYMYIYTHTPVHRERAGTHKHIYLHICTQDIFDRIFQYGFLLLPLLLIFLLLPLLLIFILLLPILLRFFSLLLLHILFLTVGRLY